MKYVLGTLGVIALVGLFLLVGLRQGHKGTAALALIGEADFEKEIGAIAREPVAWIDIESGTVTARDLKNGEILGTLASGDTITADLAIETDEDARATIHYPDGSEARLEPDTSIELFESKYAPQTETLVVRFKVTAGNVWSKIIELVTPRSRWEVETSSTVATVRGTAFGIEVRDFGTNVIGGENTVLVIPLDPETGKQRTDDAEMLSEKDVVKVNTGAARVAVVRAELASEAAEHAWTTPHADKDTIINSVRDALKEGGAAPAMIREKIRERAQDIRKERIRETYPRIREIRDHLDPWQKEALRERLENIVEGDAVGTIRDIVDKLPDEITEGEIKEHIETVRETVEQAVTEEVRPKIIEAVRGTVLDILREEARTRILAEIGDRLTPELKALIEERIKTLTPEDIPNIQFEIERFIRENNIILEKERPLIKSLRIERVLITNSPIKEGDRMEMRAILEFADGTTSDVTADTRTSWRVLGPIGSFSAPGVFLAKLDQSVVELGKSSGSIVVSWTDPETATVQFANSPIFEVLYNFDQPIDERG